MLGACAETALSIQLSEESCQRTRLASNYALVVQCGLASFSPAQTIMLFSA
jgi:hypothetical protein